MSLENNVKILYFIKKHKLNKNGEFPVFIRITYIDQRPEFGIKEERLDISIRNLDKITK